MPSRLGSVADIEASTRLNQPPTPFQASPTVLPGAVTRSLAVPIGLSAVRPADATKVSALLTFSSCAVAATSCTRMRRSSVPSTVKVPYLVCI